MEDQETKRMTPEEALRRWPRLAAHMICESLGYFTPRAAAQALIAYKANEPFACEWYSSISMGRGKSLFDDEELLRVGKDVILWSFQSRRSHKGYMAEIEQAKEAVRAELAGHGPQFASWF